MLEKPDHYYAELIKRDLREAVDMAVTAEIEKAKQAIEKAIRAQTAVIVMSVMRNFEVETMGTKLIISVRNYKDETR